MCVIFTSSTEFVFLLKSISPSFVVLIFQQWHLAQLPFCSHLSLSLPFSWSQTVKGFSRRKHTPAVNHKVGLWSGIVRGLVSNINEVAGTANICQRASNLFQLLETHRHFPASCDDGAPAVSAPLPGGTHTERNRPVCTQPFLLRQAGKGIKMHTPRRLQELSSPPPSGVSFLGIGPARKKGQRHLCKV